MNGDFLVRRGNNEFGMEVEQLAFEPNLCASGSTDSCTLIWPIIIVEQYEQFTWPKL
jgi:hypothetical protein